MSKAKKDAGEGALVKTGSHAVTIRGAEILDAFRAKKVPKKYVKKRKAPGGIMLDYVSHGHVNEALLEAFGPHGFNWEVLEAQVLEDGSTTARGRLTIFGQYVEISGQFIRTPDTIITELGSIPAATMIKTHSYLLASAASRALVRATARMGYGLEFYLKEERAQDAVEEWEYLVGYALKKLGGERKEVAVRLGAYLKELGFTEMIQFADPERSAEAYEATGQFIKEEKAKKKETTPFDEKEDEEEKDQDQDKREQEQEQEEPVLPETYADALKVLIHRPSGDGVVVAGDSLEKLLRHIGDETSVKGALDFFNSTANYKSPTEGAALVAAAQILKENWNRLVADLDLLSDKLPF